MTLCTALDEIAQVRRTAQMGANRRKENLIENPTEGKCRETSGDDMRSFSSCGDIRVDISFLLFCQPSETRPLARLGGASFVRADNLDHDMNARLEIETKTSQFAFEQAERDVEFDHVRFIGGGNGDGNWACLGF